MVGFLMTVETFPSAKVRNNLEISKKKTTFAHMMETKTPQRPRIALVDSNTLALIGLRQLLQSAMPFIEVDTFGSFTELTASQPDQYFHYFVSMDIVIRNRPFFLERRRKTIVLTLSLTETAQISDFHSLHINQPEQQLTRSLLMLQQHAHSNGRNLPPMPPEASAKVLTNREVEVMSLIVQGYINKEVAEKLGIGLATVITHRKNIMEKLGMRSISALTIYAVMHGYVDINKI